MTTCNEPMDTRTYTINEQYIRKCGRILAALAFLGLLGLVYRIISIPVVLFWVQRPAAGGVPPMEFLQNLYLHGAFAPSNTLGMTKLVLALVMIEFVRRLGNSLASPIPLGERTARSLGLLLWPCLAMSLALSVTAEMSNPCTLSGAVRAASECPWGVEFDFSTAPLYLGVLVVVGIALLRRIIQQAVMLKTESESFV